MKTYSPLSLMLLVPLLYSCSSHFEPSATGIDTIPVKVLALNQQQSNTPVAVSGQFTTDDEVMLSFKTGGIIHMLNVKEGDPIRKGQLLATLNPTEIDVQVRQSDLALEKAQRDFQRTQNLYRDSVATLEQFQNSQTALKQAQQSVRMANFNRQYSEIHAPEDGFVLSKLANAGQQVSPGTPVLRTNGAKSGKWRLRVALSDQDWAKLKIGDAATINISSLPGQSFEGKLIRKSEGVDQASGTFSADIIFAAKVPDAIAAGMFGRAVVRASQGIANAGKWQIPYEALLDGDGSEGYVFITNDNKTAKKVKVNVAGIEKNTATITGGLEGAKSLIISGSAYLTDNSYITTTNVTKP